jgi:hypothetical protein
MSTEELLREYKAHLKNIQENCKIKTVIKRLSPGLVAMNLIMMVT